MAQREFFPNGYGVSIICHDHSYGLEMAVLKGDAKRCEICYDTPITNDTLGHLTPEDLIEYIQMVKDLPPVFKSGAKLMTDDELDEVLAKDDAQVEMRQLETDTHKIMKIKPNSWKDEIHEMGAEDLFRELDEILEDMEDETSDYLAENISAIRNIASSLKEIIDQYQRNIGEKNGYNN